ncbi:hypothetical protein M758_UG224300 [Ceratodon purpureus]|nr:hypothetical protein M758_UG224300 [Ceratodon purpureus]
MINLVCWAAHGNFCVEYADGLLIGLPSAVMLCAIPVMWFTVCPSCGLPSPFVASFEVFAGKRHFIETLILCRRRS